MIFLGLGANMPGKYGPPEKALQAALDILNETGGINVSAASSVWYSAPVPVSDQPWYANAVCSIETELSPVNLLAFLKEMEAQAGRQERGRNAPRVLDLDIIAWHKVIEMETPILPHPRMHERAFVLYPLRELAPDWVHPGLECPIDELIKALLPGQQIRCGEKLLIGNTI